MGGFLLPAHSQLDSRLDYTEEELEWVKNNPVIYYSDDTAWEPFVKLNKLNQLEGISVDYLDLIRRKTGLKFQFLHSDKWSDVIANLKTRKIKLVLAAIYAKERDEFAVFTNDYFSSPLAIVTGEQYSFIRSIEELYGKRVVLPKGYYSVSYVRENHPQVEITLVDSLDDALQAVNQGEADAYIGYLPVIVYKLKLSRYSNLKISGALKEELKVRMMISKADQPLASIINKTLETISAEEKRMINDRWFNVAVETGINPQTFWQVAILTSLLITVIIFWVFKLSKEIKLRKITEEKLITAREEAEKANQAKSEFLANMSHEIRTPMNAVFGYSQLLAETKLNTEQQEYLDAIQVGSNGLLHIINDILEISKIEAGKMKIELSPVDIKLIVNEVSQLFADSMKEKSLDFSTVIAPSIPPHIITDGNRVRQILINLVGNALKFTETGFVKLTVDLNKERNEDLIFSVEDSGIGISRDRFASIFDHFEYQITPGEAHIASSGLGLSICKKLAEKLNAELIVESELDKGSRFHLVLHQVKAAVDQSALKDKTTPLQFKPSRVLIVDDVKSNRIILEKYLAPYPFDIVHAENGLEAVELAQEIQPDVVLMDVRMPVMDGFEATQKIKGLNQKIIVIAVTASALESEESKSRNLAFDAFLRKPILKTKILAVLNQFIPTQEKKSR